MSVRSIRSPLANITHVHSLFTYDEVPSTLLLLQGGEQPSPQLRSVKYRLKRVWDVRRVISVIGDPRNLGEQMDDPSVVSYALRRLWKIVRKESNSRRCAASHLWSWPSRDPLASSVLAGMAAVSFVKACTEDASMLRVAAAAPCLAVSPQLMSY